MKTLLSILLLFTVLTIQVQAQSDELRAKAEYFSAEEAYNAKNYTKCFEHLNNVEKLLGEINVRILYLRTIAGFDAGDYLTAKNAMDEFFKRQTSGNEFMELMKLSTAINKEYDRIIKEQNDFEYANSTNNITAKINFINAYPNSKYKKTITDQLDVLLWAKARETSNVSDYEKYVKNLPNGRNINKANEFLDFKKAMKANSIQNFENFKSKYPRADSIRIVDQKLKGAYLYYADLYLKDKKYNAAIDYCNKYTSTYPRGSDVAEIKDILQTSYYYIGEEHRAKQRESSAKASYNNAMKVKKTGTYYTKSNNRLEEYRLNALRIEKQGYYNEAMKYNKQANKYLRKSMFYTTFALGCVGGGGIMGKNSDDEVISFIGYGIMIFGAGMTLYPFITGYNTRFDDFLEYRQKYRREMQKYNSISVAYTPYYNYQHKTLGLSLNINF